MPHILRKIGKKSSEIWKGIRNLVSVKSANRSNINLFDNDWKMISDQKNIANKFNNYFVNVGISIENKIPKTVGLQILHE